MLTSSVASDNHRSEVRPPSLFAYPELPLSARVQHTVQLHDLPVEARQAVMAYLADDNSTEPSQETPEWSEEDVVWLHWRLLQDLDRLPDPLTPLEEKLDTLCWVFTDPQLDSRPFSFVNCLRVVGSSPLSPTPYFGRLDVETVREWIGAKAKRWLRETIELYPSWVQNEILRNPAWTAGQLRKNPQWINEQIKARTRLPQGDLFAVGSEQ